MAIGTTSPHATDADRISGTFDRDVGDVAKDRAAAVWSDAKQTARNRIAERKQMAASGIDDFAGALRAAADKLQSGQHGGMARLTQSAAGELQHMSGTLRGKDLDTIVRDAESLARRQPLAFFATAVAAGFLAVRFLKASDSAGVRDEQAGIPSGSRVGGASSH
jgi:hypothetical protein